MKQQTEQAERIYRLAPCSGYDIAEMESWLEYMAQQGYLLQKIALNLVAVFVKGQPQNLRYRLIVMPENSVDEPKKKRFLPCMKNSAGNM